MSLNHEMLLRAASDKQVHQKAEETEGIRWCVCLQIYRVSWQALRQMKLIFKAASVSHQRQYEPTRLLLASQLQKSNATLFPVAPSRAGDGGVSLTWYRLSIPYPTCLGPEMFSDFGFFPILEYLHIHNERSWGKSKINICVCFIYPLYQWFSTTLALGPNF